VVDAPGTLDWQAVSSRPELVAEAVRGALTECEFADDIVVAEIDPELADTAAFCERYRVAAEQSANCVVVAGKRAGEVSYAACMVLATHRLDVNGAVRNRLGARKASFAARTEAVELTGMEYGGITPIGVPGWPVLIDANVMDAGVVIIGSGIRRSKLALPAARLAQFAGAEVIAGLAG
jgi:prolyl-tRNA editing enzyme YbaK/EbsC (Cys-tRNA(Pro) deacylase)